MFILKTVGFGEMEREPDCLVIPLGAGAVLWGGAGCSMGRGEAEGSVVQGARDWGRDLGRLGQGPGSPDSRTSSH